MGMKEEAVSYFEQGFLCSQAILASYGPQFGVDRNIAFKLAGPFGAGMGRMGLTCGAVTGAFMVIGLKYGTEDLENEKAKAKAYQLVREFTDSFIARQGTIICRELIDCDLSTPQGLKFARDNNLFGTICTNLVREAAEFIDNLIME